MISRGTITRPPPTPKSALNSPATSPIPTRRTTVSYGGVQIPDALRALAAEPPLAALLLDVDGTLAPIAPRPEDAVVPDETRAELRRLQSRYGLLACVSGRTGMDAARVVGVPGLTIVGEHGLELAPAADEWADRVAAFADAESRPAERKRLTVSYHWREDVDEDTAVRELEQVAARAAAAGFVPRWGRKVMEVRPPIPADKGTAVRTLLERHRVARALFAGDDTTDLDAFRALDGLELAVRVAVASPEAPPGLREAADLVVGSPAELLTVLRLLRGSPRRPRAQARRPTPPAARDHSGARGRSIRAPRRRRLPRRSRKPPGTLR